MARANKTDKALKDALPDKEAIRAEYDRLMSLYKTASKEKLALARKLISRAAFLAVTIDELESDIAKNGYEEEYMNGEFQKGKKKSAAADLHVTYTKNMIAVMKQLDDMLDIQIKPKGGDPFEEF